MGSTGFNLRESVDKYINAVSSVGSLTKADAEELAAHLYDATEHLKATGLSDEEAFIIACKRMGNAAVIGDEYSKVNPSVTANKVWAYLMLGFNLLYVLPSILFCLAAWFYFYAYRHFTDNMLISVVCAFNLLFVLFVFFIVAKKNAVSAFIKREMDTHTLRLVLWSFAPGLIRIIFFHRLSFNADVTLVYPVYQSPHTLTEFTFYLAVASIPAAALCLIFSIYKPGKLRLRMLFEKPSVIFLVLYNVFITLLAASSRTLPLNGTAAITVFFVFGLIYAAGVFPVSLYNNGKLKYIIIFLLPGFLLEGISGIIADVKQGGTFFSPYYISAMLVGVFTGWLIGRNISKRKLTIETN